MKVFKVEVENFGEINKVEIFDNKNKVNNFVINYIFRMMVDNEVLEDEDKEKFVKENLEKFGEDIMNINNEYFGEEDVWFEVKEVEVK
jgi:hypothetical protein